MPLKSRCFGVETEVLVGQSGLSTTSTHYSHPVHTGSSALDIEFPVSTGHKETKVKSSFSSYLAHVQILQVRPEAGLICGRKSDTVLMFGRVTSV